ncbi:glycoside hydrolase family 16 protein [Spirochaeta dissipatitropha]
MFLIKSAFITVIVIFFSGCIGDWLWADAGVNQPVPDSDWALVWGDDFTSPELDLSNWDFDLGDGSVRGIPGWGNHELQYYTNDEQNVFIRDNKLVIRAVKESRSDALGSGSYTSARLVTRGLHSWKYGRIEARMRLPEGQGLWPAFWMMPEPPEAYGTWAASGEIDIMEARGSNTGSVSGAIHFGGQWPDNTYRHNDYDLPNTLTTDFNEYAIEWEEGEIRWYVNDRRYYTVREWFSMNPEGSYNEFPAPFDQPFHIILNLAVGGWFDGNPPSGADYFPAEMEIDYVRVFEMRE